jgi:hypothetical protein
MRLIVVVGEVELNDVVSRDVDVKNWWQPTLMKRVDPAVQIGPVKKVASLSVTTFCPSPITSIDAK